MFSFFFFSVYVPTYRTYLPTMYVFAWDNIFKYLYARNEEDKTYVILRTRNPVQKLNMKERGVKNDKKEPYD